MVVSQEELTATGDATASKKRKTSGGCRPKDDGFGPIWVGVSGGGGGKGGGGARRGCDIPKGVVLGCPKC